MSLNNLRVRVYSHFFILDKLNASSYQVVTSFARKFIHKGFRNDNSNSHYSASNKNDNDKRYFVTTDDGTQFRFIIGLLDLFKKYVYDTTSIRLEDSAVIEYVDLPKAMPLGSTNMKPHIELRERQPEVIDFIMESQEAGDHSRLVCLPTGGGKTVCAMWAITRIRKRTVVIVLPKYIDKWRGDIKDLTNATDDDILVVKGGDSLRGLIEMAENNQIKEDFIIISLVTWNLFVKAYEVNPYDCKEQDYGCDPEELFGMIGAGVLLVDEAHEFLNAVYRLLCFTNISLFLGLSGTFRNMDPFLEDIQKYIFPRVLRFEKVKMKKYIRSYGISYTMPQEYKNKVKTTERGSTSYSQVAFERSILGIPELKRRYNILIDEVLNNSYLCDKQEGDKAIIFARTKNMCTTITEFLSKRYPHLDVRRYISGDDYANVIDADVRVTTQKSAGTAIDIPGLITNITTDNVRSEVAILQCFGRLRETKNGSVPKYFSVYCENIPKHVKYQQERVKLLSDRFLSHKEFRSNVGLNG